jgi:hypothetical protein
MVTICRGVRGRTFTSLAVVLILAWVGPLAQGQTPAPDRAASDTAALAQRIDHHLMSRWSANGVKPTGPADDAEFLRRASLDVTGRIPRVNVQMHEWLADTTPDKRRRLVEQMLNGPLYVEHFTNVWRHLLLPPGNNQQAQALAASFDPWLRKQFKENVPYNVMVRELLTTPLAAVMQPGMPQPMNSGPTPVAFYLINESKAENIAASASRLFLGVKLECAQCHNHPFNTAWKKKQFWEFAAFFSGVQSRGDNPKKRTIALAGGDEIVEARFLDGTVPKWQDDVPTRRTLADWVTAPDNPYFARNAVNRLWAHFFGIGLVEPVDEPGPDNPPSHPELLDELARELVAHNFDVKFMIRAITSTRAYQLSSTATDPSQKDPRQFARMTVKGMSGEQLFDSLAEATGYAELQAPNRGPNPMNTARAEFLAKFNSATGKRTEYQTSILQALSLMNGRVIADATALDRGRLGAVGNAPFWDTGRRIEELYLSAVARKPLPEELDRLVKYVYKGGPSVDPKKALADVFWALLNSSEFIFNH